MFTIFVPYVQKKPNYKTFVMGFEHCVLPRDAEYGRCVAAGATEGPLRVGGGSADGDADEAACGLPSGRRGAATGAAEGPPKVTD